MHRLAQRGQFNGSIIVAEHGKIIYENGFGVADIGHDITFTPSTPCYLASLTKQFTAMAIMILAGQKRLSYDDALSKYFPEFPPYAQTITIQHLLHHTSGIPDYVRLGLEHPGLTNQEVVQALVRQDTLRFRPGDKFEYSNSGYILLAMIIEKVSGVPYRVFLKEHIFNPLGMAETFVYDASHPDIPGKARGYNRFGDDADYDLLTYGEGGIYSSAEDLYKWDQALYTDKLVESSTLAMAFVRPTLNDGSASSYGFGWAITEDQGQTITSHAGRYGGFNTYIKRFTRDHTTIIFLTNHDFKDMGSIGNALIHILYEKPFLLPKLSMADAMYRTYKSAGTASAIQQYRSLKGKNDTTYDFSESELNELGYEFLGMKNFRDAIEILRINAEAYPASSNVYDGLGEAYMDNGDKDLAIKNYKKSLELDPGNMNAVSMLKKLGDGQRQQ